MWRKAKAIIKWTLIAVALVVAASGLLYLRDSRRDEDFWSCSIQAQDKTTISTAKSGAEPSDGVDQAYRDEVRASTNVSLDACMKERRHSFTGGSRLLECAIDRRPWCYSLL
jgi:hypothetical protein